MSVFMGVGLVVNKEVKLHRLNLEVTVFKHRGLPASTSPEKVECIHINRIGIQNMDRHVKLKRNSAVLPLRVNTTSTPFLVRKITIGDIHFHISISFSISSSLLNVFSSGWVSSNVSECS